MEMKEIQVADLGICIGTGKFCGGPDKQERSRINHTLETSEVRLWRTSRRHKTGVEVIFNEGVVHYPICRSFIVRCSAWILIHHVLSYPKRRIGLINRRQFWPFKRRTCQQSDGVFETMSQDMRCGSGLFVSPWIEL